MSDRRMPAGRAASIPRGPRFAAGITALLLLVDVFLGLTTPHRRDRRRSRAVEPAFLLLLAIALLFLWSVLSPRTAPWGVLYRILVQPRLKPADRARRPAPAALRAGRRPLRGRRSASSCTWRAFRGRCRSPRRRPSSRHSSTRSSGCASAASSTCCCSAPASSAASAPLPPETARTVADFGRVRACAAIRLTARRPEGGRTPTRRFR